MLGPLAHKNPPNQDHKLSVDKPPNYQDIANKPGSRHLGSRVKSHNDILDNLFVPLIIRTSIKIQESTISKIKYEHHPRTGNTIQKIHMNLSNLMSQNSEPTRAYQINISESGIHSLSNHYFKTRNPQEPTSRYLGIILS